MSRQNSRLDEVAAPRARQQLAVKPRNDVERPVGLLDDLEDREGVRIEVHAPVATSRRDDDAHGLPCVLGQDVLVQRRVRHGLQRGADLRFGREPGAGDRQPVIWTVEQRLYLRSPEIDRAGQRQPDDERDAEQAGVECQRHTVLYQRGPATCCCADDGASRVDPFTSIITAPSLDVGRRCGAARRDRRSSSSRWCCPARS